MSFNRIELARLALDRAVQVRDEMGFSDRVPICIYDICKKLAVDVRFVDVNMEGMYVRKDPAEILLSSLRPLPRRAFTCAHELGHHVFGHGSTIDELKEEAETCAFDPDEFLVDSFAGHLLMPKIAVRKAFALRSFRETAATAEQVYVVACSLGVGYDTLLTHMSVGLRLITAAQTDSLRKTRLPSIRKSLLNESSSEPLLVVDLNHQLPTADAEVGSQVLLPRGVRCDSPSLLFQRETGHGDLFKAVAPGIARVSSDAHDWAVLTRISRYQYVGLCEFRHLEEENDDG